MTTDMKELLERLMVADPETWNEIRKARMWTVIQEDEDIIQFYIQRAISSKEGWSWALFGVDAKAVKALVSLSKDNNYKSNAESAAPALLSAYLAALGAQR